MALHLSPSQSRLLANAALALAIVAGGWISHRWFTFGCCGTELVWLPSGLAVGAVLCCGWRRVPGVLVGVGAWAWLHEPGPGDALRQCATMGLEVLLAAGAMRYWRFDRDFVGIREVGLFLGGAVVAPPLFAGLASFGVGWCQGVPWPGRLAAALPIASHMAGIGVLAPVLILSNSRWWSGATPMRLLIAVLLLCAGPVIVAAEALGSGPVANASPMILVPLPLAALLVVSYGLAPAIQAVLLMELTLVALTAAGLGPFRQGSSLDVLLGLGGFMTLLTGMTLLLGGIKRLRRRGELLAMAAMNSARVAQWTWQEGRGVVIDDPEWSASFGVPAGVGASPEQIDAVVHPDDRFSLRLWCGGEEHLPPDKVEEFRLRRPDGGWRWVTSRRLHHPPEFGAVPGTIHGVFQDVSERKESEQWRLDAAQRDAELRNLKLSIQPHFLFNSLNSLRSLIASRPDEAREFVSRLATFLHTAVADSGEDLLPLARSLAVVEVYLEIERTRFGERLRVREEVTEEARAAAFPPLLLQTLVENALKYGVAKRPEGGEIRIEASVTDGRLRVAVGNEGRIVAAPANALGTGLKSADRRVKLLFGESAFVRLHEDATPRVTAEVVVPLQLMPTAKSSILNRS